MWKLHNGSIFCISNNNIECQWLEITNPNQRYFIFCNAYRPPQGDIDEFVTYLESCLKLLDFTTHDVFIIGDFNIDFLERQNPLKKKLKEFLAQTGFTNLFTTLTRYTPNKNSALDHIPIQIIMMYKSGVLDVNISDHEMVYVVCKKTKTVPVTSRFTGSSYRNYNKDQFIHNLDLQDLKKFMLIIDPNDFWQKNYDNILLSINTLCPLKTFNIKKVKEYG